MSSLPVEPLGTQPDLLRGVQTPRIFCGPDGDEAQGADVADFLARNGLVLDPWQRFVFQKGLAEQPNGLWSAFEVVLTVGRQNGKTLLMAAREIAGMFLFEEELIVHTAHQWKTADKSFALLKKIVEHAPQLKSKVRRFSASPGKDVMLLKDGRSVEFIARTKDSGVGWSADCVIMDEAFDLVSEELSALMPTVLAMPNPQLWYTSSAAKAHSEHLHLLRERAMKGESDNFCFMEWSAPADCDPEDRHAWAQANPALGFRITEDRFANLQRSLPAPQFGRECLGWPDSLGAASVFGVGVWETLASDTSCIAGPVTFGVAVADDRSAACVAAAGLNIEGLTHVEVGKYAPNDGWVVDYLTELASRRSVKVVVRPSSQAGSLIYELEARKIDVLRVSMTEYAAYCGNIYDSVTKTRDLAHLAEAPLDISASAAQLRRTGDAFVWEQRNPHTDISPLEAVTLAFGYSRRKKPPARFVSFS